MFDTDTLEGSNGFDGFSLDFDETPDLGQEVDVEKEEHEEVKEEVGQKPTVSQEQYEKLLQDLAEARGKAAAYETMRRREPEPSVVVEPPRTDQSALEAQLRARLKSVASKMYDPETADEGLMEFLQLTTQIGSAQAEQYIKQNVGSGDVVVGDMMIERFMDKKERSDKLFDKVQPLVDAELDKVDRRVVAKMTRKQLDEAMETLYKSKRADVLDDMYQTGLANLEKKKTAASSVPPTFSGKSGASGNAAAAARAKKISETQRKLALDAGIPEDEIDALFDEGNDEW